MDALSQDNSQLAADNLKEFRRQLERIIAKDGPSDISEGLIKSLEDMAEDLQAIEPDLGALREMVSRISYTLKDILENYGYLKDAALYLNFCPMSFDGQGGYLIADTKKITNPYFGVKMIQCGETKKTFGSAGFSEKPTKGTGHRH